MPVLKLCKQCAIEKPMTDFHKDRTARLGISSTCKVCKLQAAAERHRTTYVPKPRKQAQDTNKVKQRSYLKNRDKTLERRRNTDRSEVRTWQTANPEKVKAYKDTWKRNNPHKLSAGSRKRRIARGLATPSWNDEEFEELLMREIYDLAKLRTQTTGTEWHVDHRVPLVSEIVCGLHCSANLQVIPANVNLSKSNRYWEYMP